VPLADHPRSGRVVLIAMLLPPANGAAKARSSRHPLCRTLTNRRCKPDSIRLSLIVTLAGMPAQPLLSKLVGAERGRANRRTSTDAGR
jgi:hypothetical protein